MGRGFWKFDNSLLRDTNYVTGCNQMIKTVMKRYSLQLQELYDPKDAEYAQAKWDITPVLLHDILLMETRSYTMKYKAFKKKESERLAHGLKTQIKEILDSDKAKDVTKLGLLKKFLQDLTDYEDNDAAMKLLASHHLEGEKLRKFFCSIIEK